MSEQWIASAKDLVSVIDFIRFGLTKANAQQLHYGHGTDNSLDEMYALILGCLSLPMDADALMLQARLTDSEKEMLAKQLRRRIMDRVPVPYLTHQAYFCGLSFYVDERVLIPRSPIAELIEQQFSPWINPEVVTSVLDLCTGSGCIAIACGYAFPEAEIDAVDISTDALEVARMNQVRHQMADQLTLIESDVFARVPERHYNIIVSNPPYVGGDEMQTLPAEYRHEPVLALEAPQNGLAVVDTILQNAHHYLSEQGILVVEVGNSADALMAAYPDLEFTWIDFERGGEGVFILTREQLVDYFG
jgi:ribosomal protein L3 glutamine methyltransferase